MSTPNPSDIGKIQSGIGDKLSVFLQYVSTFISGFVIAFIFSWKLALVTATMLPLIALLAGTIARVKPYNSHCISIYIQGIGSESLLGQSQCRSVNLIVGLHKIGLACSLHFKFCLISTFSIV